MPNVLPSLAVLYIEVQRMSLCRGNGQILWVDIPETIVHNFEVVSKPEFNTLIRNFVGTHTITGGPLILIFSEAIAFEKFFAGLPSEQKESEFQVFYESVPFERTLTRAYPFQNGSKAIAINRDLYESIRDAFEQVGFQILAVVPGYVMTMMGFNTFDVETAKQIIKKFDTVKQQTMISIHQPTRTIQQQEDELAKKHTPLILLIFFVFLGIVLGGTILILRLGSNVP
ncbi:hypothetical protein A2863_04385 [Candidatus Woesebacteria bacterium RIFCSPHIGHO2_01_FULL_38_9b]|uniref:Uncharacterized protein n=1 Tax=Candidatus Woesebacteria bacterium RIFCSPHIGHO2_01_FULL_38_9b TaxID=1802493 RepID=A0A1F7Y3F6_9BACT|nr:MAG: hypothetical protein A2863_04385 [Candidatus Woesebacteria bacterium RIFCSPHIGHO2_01_FULL_38_9b]